MRAASLTRTLDATFLNRVMNDPSVRPFIGDEGYGSVDASVLITNPANVCLVNKWGGFIFVLKMPGVYEIHTQFLPAGRGARAVIAAKEAADFMFTMTDAERLVTWCPDDNPASLGLSLRAGLERYGRKESATLMRLTKARWQTLRARTSPKMEAHSEPV